MNNIWGHLWQLNSRLPALVCNLADGDSNYIYVQTRLKFRPCVSGEGGWEEVRQLLVKKQQRKKKWKEFRITRSVSNFFLVNFLFPPFWKGVGWAAPGRQRFLSPAAVDIWNVSAIGSLKFNYKREKQVQLQQNQLLVFSANDGHVLNEKTTDDRTNNYCVRTCQNERSMKTTTRLSWPPAVDKKKKTGRGCAAGLVNLYTRQQTSITWWWWRDNSSAFKPAAAGSTRLRNYSNYRMIRAHLAGANSAASHR